jgi:hypothetical protein
MSLSLAIFLASIAFQICVLSLLARNALWRMYPFFSIYAIVNALESFILLAAYLRFLLFYSTLYWRFDSVDVVLRFLVVWEVFHQMFPKGSGLNRSLSKSLAMVAFLLLILACGAYILGGYQNYTSMRSIGPALDSTFGFVQAVMILGTLLMARYHGVKYGRNVSGIALAFGGWLSILTASSAMAELTSSFLPYWFYLRPLSFVAMMVAWLWALWVYEPTPQINGPGALAN